MPSQTQEILKHAEKDLLAAWMTELQASSWGRDGVLSPAELQQSAADLLHVLGDAARRGLPDIDAPDAAPLRNHLDALSRTLAMKGATSSQTAHLVFSLKKPLFARLRKDVGDAGTLATETWAATDFVDGLGLYTVRAYQKTREELIRRQQEEMLELSTPVVKLWEGVLALPMIGTLDSSRTQVVMESLLQRIVETGSEMAIIDITGVPTVDTLVAQHLLRTVAAARLMGADCIISGIRPQIASTIVHLGVDLSDVITKASLADAFALALERVGLAVGRAVQRR